MSINIRGRAPLTRSGKFFRDAALVAGYRRDTPSFGSSQADHVAVA